MLDAVQDGGRQLPRVIHVELLLLGVRRTGKDGAGVGKRHRHAARTAGDLVRQIQVPAGELRHTGDHGLRGHQALLVQLPFIGHRVFLKCPIHADVQGVLCPLGLGLAPAGRAVRLLTGTAGGGLGACRLLGGGTGVRAPGRAPCRRLASDAGGQTKQQGSGTKYRY